MDDVVEEAASGIDFVLLGMYDMFAAVSGWVQDMIVSLVPIMGPIVGGIILATLGYRLVKRLAK